MTVFDNREEHLKVWNDKDFRLLVWSLFYSVLLSYGFACFNLIYRYTSGG